MIRVAMVAALNTLDLGTRLRGATLSVLQGAAVKLLSAIREHWQGWKYATQPLKSIGRSRAAWTVNVQSTQHPYGLIVSNAAIGYYSHKPYVKYVARHKGARLEYLIVYDKIFVPHVNAVSGELNAAIHKALTDQTYAGEAPVKLRTNRAYGTKRIYFD